MIDKYKQACVHQGGQGPEDAGADEEGVLRDGALLRRHEVLLLCTYIYLYIYMHILDNNNSIL